MSPVQRRPIVACIAAMGVLLGTACASPIKTTHDSDPEARIKMVEAMGAVADEAGYSGIVVRAAEGPVVAEWLKNTGAAVRQASDGGS